MHERQHACHLPLIVAGREVQAFVSEDLLDDRLPAPPVKVRPSSAGLYTRVPLRRGSRNLGPVKRHAAESAATVSRTAVNRNSASSRSSRWAVPRSPP